jgi:pimeloyl-ACP methyl ester carboxylesterase
MQREIESMHATAKAFLSAHPDAAANHAGIFSVSAGPPAAPTFIMVHGSPGSWADFGIYLDDPALTADLHLVAPDRPGYGRSPAGTNPPSLSDQAARLATWAETLPVAGKRYWLGHSFGASIIARLAIDRPDLVDGMILLAGAMDPEWEKPRWFHRVADTALLHRIIGPAMSRANDEALAFFGDLTAMEPDWGRIQCRVTIIHAKDDTLADFRHVAFTTARLDPAKTEVIDLKDGDHFLPWNRKSLVVSAMRRMAGLETSSP